MATRGCSVKSCQQSSTRLTCTMHCDLGGLCPGDTAVKAAVEVAGLDRSAGRVVNIKPVPSQAFPACS
jgi:hypothetical protein